MTQLIVREKLRASVIYASKLFLPKAGMSLEVDYCADEHVAWTMP